VGKGVNVGRLVDVDVQLGLGKGVTVKDGVEVAVGIGNGFAGTQLQNTKERKIDKGMIFWIIRLHSWFMLRSFW
jgi:hypothetical protein